MKNSTCSVSDGKRGDIDAAPLPVSSPFLRMVDSPQSWYALGILTIAFAIAYIDRQLLNLIVEPIKHDLQISDTQISFIQGAAFIAAYLLATPIVGRLVDVANRRNILVLGICLWCVCTVICGWVHTYEGLFIARFGVGASEACVLPAGWSIISDYFSAQRRARALSIFMVGPMIGGGLSLVAGGLVIAFAAKIRQHLPMFNGFATWQLAFIFVGLPGLLVAMILLTVREPARSQSHLEAAAMAGDRRYTIREAAAFFVKRRGFYGRIYVGIGMFGIVYLGLPVWLPSFLIRDYKVAPALVGYFLGMTFLTASAAGVLLGPWFARLLERRGYQDAAVRAVGFAALGMLLFCAIIPLASGYIGALLISAGAIFFCSVPVGVLPAVLQTGTPSRLRGVVASLYTIFGNGIGLGVGPTAIALVTDKVFGNPMMVGYSIEIVGCVASIAATWVIFSAQPHYRRALGDDARDARSVLAETVSR